MKSFVTSIAAGSLLAVLAAAQSPRYAIIDLGVLPAPGQPYAVSNNGLIAGAAARSDDTGHAILWYLGLGLEQDIGVPGLGGPNSIVFGVNVKGQAVGEAQTSTPDPNGEDFCGFGALGFKSSGACPPSTWQSGRMAALPTLGGRNGQANGINGAGEIAGTAENTTLDPGCVAPQLFQFEPVVWQNGKVQPLPTYPGDTEGVAYSINDSGDAAGATGVCAAFNPGQLNALQALHAVLWQSGTPTYLGTLGGTGQFLGISAQALNNSDQVVGVSDLAGDMTGHAFLWTRATGMRDLGTLPGDFASVGLSINDSGLVTGVSLDANFNGRAFVWQDGVMSDLSALLPASSPLLPMLACSVNANGLILGQAINKTTGDMHGYLAIPSSALSASDRAALAEAEVAAPVELSSHARHVLQDRARLGRFGARLPVR